MMMKFAKYTALFFLLLWTSVAYSQKEGNIWYFGKYAGLTFKSGNPKPLKNSAMFQYEGCATISDTLGNLMFYTNGITVWNKNHQVMKNGTKLNGGYSSTQSSIAVPKPLDDDIYYIFTIDDVAGTNGLQYSIVDMSKEGGLGRVTSKNNSLLAPTTEKVTALKHRNDTDTWVITHGWDTNAFYAYKITPSGIDTKVTVSSVGSKHEGSLSKASGYMKASPDGTKLAIAIETYFGTVEIFDFNDSTGVISNPVNITLTDPYGIEFSPDGTKLFVSSSASGKIYQYNLEASTEAAIRNSEYLIGSSSSQVGALQIAIDGKIYVARTSSYLGVIKKPNEYGPKVDYYDKGVYLGGRESKYGLPTFNQSYFFNPDFYYENFCFGDTTKFYVNNTTFVDSVQWNFDDPNSGSDNYSNLLKPKHVFSEPGTYKVGLLIYHQNVIDTITWNIPIHPKPKAAFAIGDSTQCLDGNLFHFINQSKIESGHMRYDWDFGDTGTTDLVNPTHTYGVDDTFDVTLITISDYGCLDTAVHKPIVFPMPQADYKMNDSAQCFDKNLYEFTNTTYLKSGKLSYYWDFGDGNTATKKNPEHTYRVADTFEVMMIATSRQGCADTITKTTYVHIHPSPLAEFMLNDTSQCFDGNFFKATNTSYLSKGTMTFEWSFGNGDSSFTKDPTYIYDSNGEFNITLVAISDYNCKDKMVQKVKVNPMPDAEFSTSDTALCLKDNKVTFSNKSKVNYGSMNYLWEFGDGQTSTYTNPEHEYLYDGDFTVKLFVSTPEECYDSAKKLISILPMPNIDFSINDKTQCLSSNFFSFINATTLNSGKVDSFNWSFGDGNSSVLKSPSHTYNTYDQYRVRLAAVTDRGCIDSFDKTVFVFPMPEADFVVDNDKQCLNDNNFLFQDSSSIPEGIITNYIWKVGDGNTYSTNSFFHSYSSDGVFEVKHYAISDEGCMDSSAQRMEVFPIPNTDFSISDDKQCLNDNEFFFIDQSSISTGNIKAYLWDFGDGNQSTSQGPTHSYSAHQNYKVMLKTISDKNCLDSTFKTVYVYPVPNTDFSINTGSQCLNDNLFEFTQTTSIASGTISGYNWDFGDTNVSTLPNPNHTYTKDGNYQVKLKVSSNHGCNDSVLKQIVVHPMPEVAFDHSQPCLETTMEFYDQTTINAPDNIASRTWDFGDGSFAYTENPNFYYASPGIYRISLVATSNNNCVDSLVKSIKVNEHLSQNKLIRATVENDEYVLIEWTASPTGSPKSYILERSDNGKDYSRVATLSPKQLFYEDMDVEVDNQSYYYRVKVIDSCNFETPYTNIGKSILLKVAEESDPPFVSWSHYKEWDNGVSQYTIQLKNEDLGTFSTLDITSPDSNSYYDTKNKTLMDQYCYRVIASESGSQVSSTSNVICKSIPLLVWVPNSFTPNQDGLNDIFKAEGKYITDFELIIFNRWGEEMWRTNSLDEGWDGKYKGRTCEIGTYYFRMVAKGTKNQKKILKGTFHLLR